MKIKSIRVQNFRTLADVSIEFDSVTTFIGPNGVGKSTVLKALDWYFNGGPGQLSEMNCSFGATEFAIEVEVTFDQLSNKDREVLGKYAPVGTSTFTAWKRRAPDGTETFSANAKSFPPFNVIRSSSSATEKRKNYADLRSSRPDLGLIAASSAAAIDQVLTAWEAEHADQLVEAPEALQTNFFGFNGSARMSGLFDFVLVTANLRASEESIDGKSSIIGRILERTVDRSAADDAIAEIVAESQAKQQAVYDANFSGQLSSLTAKLNQVVESYSPGRSVAVIPSEVELKSPRTTFTLTIQDGPTETFVDRQGHGFQRTLLISSLQLLAQSGTASEEGVICLAIEEPELFQHPIQAQAFAKVLRSLAQDPASRIQVTYATHSPYFLEAKHFDQVRRITRNSSIDRGVTVHAANVDQVVNTLEGVTDPEVVARQLDKIVSNQLQIALFAERALIVEGTTEVAVILGIGDRETEASIETSGIAVVAAGGKTAVPIPHAILSLLGIPSYVLFDADGGAESRAREKKTSPKAIDSERKKNASENRKLLRYFGMPEEDFPSRQVGDNVAILEDHLESFLELEWPEWMTACSDIEGETGVKLSKNQQAYRAATCNAEGDVPPMLAEVIHKVKAL